MTVTRLQELYAQALARRETMAASSCVTPEELLALVQREGPENRRLEILDHVMGCSACHREYDLLRAVQAAGAETAGRPAARSIGRRVMPLALAASLVVAVGVGVVVRNRAEPVDTPRGGTGDLILLAPPTEVAPGQPLTFTWRAIQGAQSYRLEVLDGNDSVVFSQSTLDTSLVWLGNGLRPGSSYRWWVRDATPGAQRAAPLRPLLVRRK